MTVARSLAVVCLCSALVAGCGEDDDATTTTAATTTAAEATGRGGPGVTVGMKDFAFDPQEISIIVGEEVTWRNDDSAEHNIVGQGVEDPPTSDNLGLGQTYTWRALQAGTVDYLCTIHPNMTGKITVEK
ncbi:plastocyanin/azurin family copper-binding protein [Svornostia abyssi]|uniref:Plastocyanin/azurin family copper-binding protein n=1 Tax=Svornostia abyssi TaxID=2898438 RepID=A0ABY5PJS0_9ACTN|nr:plastocyanin/azurin family copper-binding protein [Parviterribacteraceae bacterium J379]